MSRNSLLEADAKSEGEVTATGLKHRFASNINRKPNRFNSRHLCQETESINVFSFDWSNEANLFVSPTYLILRAIKHVLKSLARSKAILICPYCPFSSFLAITSLRSRYIFPFCQRRILDRRPKYLYKAGRQQEIDFRLTRLPRLFHCKFNDKIMSQTIEKKEQKFSCHYKCNQAGTKDNIPTGKQKFS